MPNLVYVVDGEGEPLLPTCGARARILLKKGKAKMYSVIPFTIQLNRIVNNPKGEFRVGIDDGAKEVGISVAYWDIIKAHHNRLGTVIGSVRSLKKNCITLRIASNNNFPVSYNKSTLLWRSSNIIYC